MRLLTSDSGAFCDNGAPCDHAHSTCGGTSQNCHGYGPGRNEFESNAIIGTQQFEFVRHTSFYNEFSQYLERPCLFLFTLLFLGIGNFIRRLLFIKRRTFLSKRATQRIDTRLSI